MEKKLKETLPGGRFDSVSPTRSKAMSAVRGRGNRTTERRLRLALVRASMSGWKIHVRGIVGNPDFFFADFQVAVFVDGCFWHGCERCGHIPNTNRPYWSEKIRRTKERDIEKTEKLWLSGITVIQFWEHELQQDLPACIEKLRNALNQRQEHQQSQSASIDENIAVL